MKYIYVHLHAITGTSCIRMLLVCKTKWHLMYIGSLNKKLCTASLTKTNAEVPLRVWDCSKWDWHEISFTSATSWRLQSYEDTHIQWYTWTTHVKCMLAHTLPIITGMHYRTHTHTQCYCYAAIFYADESRTCLLAHSHNTHILMTGLFNNGIWEHLSWIRESRP